MTIETTTNKVLYSGTGAQVAFPYTFRVFAATDMVVIKRSVAGVETQLTLNTDFTVSGVGDVGGGTVTLIGDYAVGVIPGPPATGEKILIKRLVPLKQETDYTEGGAFLAESHEAALDRLVCIAQQQQEQLDRAIVADGTDENPPTFADIVEAVASSGDSAAAAALSAGTALTAQTATEAARDEVVAAVGSLAQATDSVAGIVELATDVEVIAGTDAERVVTPAGLASALAAADKIPKSLGTTKGDLIGFVDNETPDRLGVGADGQVLKARSGSVLGVAWGDAAFVDVSSEVSITGSTTLSASAFGKMHVCTGTTADYTIGLPAAAGNAGKLIGIRISNACTKLVTLDGNASELIDGALTRVMWAGESAILLCDGVGWVKISGKSIPMRCQLGQSAQQLIAPSTYTYMILDGINFDFGPLSYMPSYGFRVQRPGLYSVSLQTGYAMPTPTTTVLAAISRNEILLATGGGHSGGASSLPTITALVQCAQLDIIRAQTYHAYASSANTAYWNTFFSIWEVVTW